ncbi:levansucrase [Haladaptatus litoreus]|uniref:Levansucrase n=1 Tax=Haladaptatus litoreus TaxID=553468 RepID=A0A1N7FEK5_9EURY|nr:glycoside hydrolase family 68 protein [Haladaptatus litoreus]SIR98747.1 levansucrase [Haladaptatus litoreus]
MSRPHNGRIARSKWTRDHASRLRRTPDTTAPIIYPPEQRISDEYHLWDTWFLRERDGSLAEVDGYRVAFSLSASSSLLPGKRHDEACIRYFYSTDGREWTYGGPIFTEGEAFGSRQWAGSVLLDDGDIYAYYTAAGLGDEPELTYEQRICVGTGGTIVTDEEGFHIDGQWNHSVLLEPDGKHYQTQEQSMRQNGPIYTFRDPWFFEDPETEETYLLFEGNTPIDDPDPERTYNGCIGIAHSEMGDPTDWEFLDPLLDGERVNQELERPHIVVRNERYYLFTPSHQHTFAPGLSGFDALYGFVADSLFGPYEPLNETGLVVANPDNAPFQAYSWLAFGHGDEILVTSFFNYFDLNGLSLNDVAFLPESEQLRRFGGTYAPTLRLQVAGNRTRIWGELEYGRIPLEEESLTAPDHVRYRAMNDEDIDVDNSAY